MKPAGKSYLVVDGYIWFKVFVHFTTPRPWDDVKHLIEARLGPGGIKCLIIISECFCLKPPGQRLVPAPRDSWEMEPGERERAEMY